MNRKEKSERYSEPDEVSRKKPEQERLHHSSPIEKQGTHREGFADTEHIPREQAEKEIHDIVRNVMDLEQAEKETHDALRNAMNKRRR